MLVKLPPIESELFDTWEKHVEANPELKNAPIEAREAFEQSTDDFFAMIMLIASF